MLPPRIFRGGTLRLAAPLDQPSKGRSTQEKYEEGRALKREFAAERAKLEAVREKMVLDMERKGISVPSWGALVIWESWPGCPKSR